MGHAKTGGALVEYEEWLGECALLFELYCYRARIPEYRSLGSLRHDVRSREKNEGMYEPLTGLVVIYSFTDAFHRSASYTYHASQKT